MKKNIVFICLLVICIVCQSQEIIKSPDKSIVIKLSTNADGIFYSLTKDDYLIIEKSRLGIVCNGKDLSKEVKITNIERSSLDEKWKPIAGRYKTIRNHYNQLNVSLKANGENYDIVFRVFNDGVGFRYEFPRNKEIFIEEDKSEVIFKNNGKIWATNGEKHNVGPVNLIGGNFPNTLLPPVVYQNKQVVVSIIESAIFDNAPFRIYIKRRKLGFSMGKSKILNKHTSWRTVIVGKRPGDMITATIVKNLNPPPSQDFSWVKPGKSLWDWRVLGHKTTDGFVYKQENESCIRFIDFASKNNIEYFLIDANWYGPEFNKKSDPTKSHGAIDIQKLLKYANLKSIKIILYLNDVGAKKFGLERVLKQFHDWGIAGVKYGFMKGTGQEKVLHTRKIVELCAKYKLLVDFHDNPIPPSGDDRTYPNLVTKEFCHAQSDAKRSYYPETAVTACFINQVAGPLDQTNGWYDLNMAHKNDKVFEEIPSTIAAENAKLVVYYSPLTVLPDAPDSYEKKSDLFEFIRKLPNSFDDMKVINDVIGESITVARSKYEEWFVGSLTNRTPRRLDIPLNFLKKGIKYIATIYSDTDSSHFEKNKEDYKIKTMIVDSTTIIHAKLAAGGGHSMWIRKQKTNI